MAESKAAFNELTENGLALVELLKDNVDRQVTMASAAEALGLAPRSITGVMNALVKKGIAIREDYQTVGEDGKPATVKLFKLTDLGIATDFVLKAPKAKKEDAE